MKTSAILACCAIVAAFALLAACSPDTSSETASCMDCHSGDTTNGNALLAAQAGYDVSGHLNGPRTLDPNVASTGHLYIFHGSNAMYTNGGSCVKCHNHEAFVDYVATGTPASFYGAASPPQCFTCHKPHISGDFSLRKETSENLVDGTSVFNWGKGNLCVTCHKALTRVGDTSLVSTSAFFNTTTTFPKSWRSSDGPHHGPQADLMMGKNNYLYPAKTYVTVNDHFDAALPDSCVSCHLWQPAAREGGTLQLGGHGMYLAADVHGSNSNLIGPCRTCHNYPVSGSGSPILVQPTSAGTGSLTGGFETALSPDTNINTTLADIRALRNLLLAYFGNGAANFTGSGTGPIVGVDDGLDQTTGEWGLDWEFDTASLTETQSYAFWNFKLFIEDKSHGIHNPIFAYEVLYDSAQALGISVAAFTRP